MVSVPGGSKGCQKCRQRKVKCDEGKPDCARCIKLGIQCPGYYRPVQFAKKRGSKGSPSSEIPDPIPAISVAGPSEVHFSEESIESLNESIYSSTSSPEPLSLSLPQMSEMAQNSNSFQGRIVSDYLSSAASSPQPNQMTDMDAYFAPNTEALEIRNNMLTASALSYSGKMYGDNDLANEGAIMYNGVLHQMSHSLADEQGSWRHPDFLHGCLVALVHEFTISKNPTSWLKHLQGVSQIVEALGPYTCAREPVRSIFISVQALITIQHIITGKRCFLERKEWQTIPWLNQKRSQYENLICHFACIPAFIQDLKHILEHHNYTPLFELADRVITLYSTLLNWRANWNESHFSDMWEVPAYTLSTPDHLDEYGFVFENALWYSNIAHSNSVLLYDATMIVLCKLIRRICPLLVLHQPLYQQADFFPAVQGVNWSVMSENMDSYIQECAIEICRTMNYCTRPENLTVRVTYVVFGGKTAYDVLGGANTREGRFVEKVLAYVKAMSGSELCDAAMQLEEW